MRGMSYEDSAREKDEKQGREKEVSLQVTKEAHGITL